MKNTQKEITKRCSKCNLFLSLSLFHKGRGKFGKACVCKTCVKERSHKYYLKNRKKICDRNENWRQSNPEKYKKITAKQRKRLRQNLQWHIDRRILRKVDKYAKHGISRISRTIPEYALGYSFEDLKNHIQNLFQTDMTWELFVSGEIEIDHIIPRSSFYYESVNDEDFKLCCSLSNLRPIWKKENRSKSDLMPDGTKGREVGKIKKEIYERNLIEKSAGAIPT